MGRRGPAPTPNEILQLRGSRRARKAGARIQPAEGRPKCPTWLSPEAKAVWKQVLPELKRLHLLTILDRAALASYCQACAEFEIATKILQTEGRFFKTETGYLTPHPCVAMQRSAMSAIKTFAQLFGLDPSSRTRLPTPPAPQEKDPFAEFLNRRLGSKP